MHPFCLINSFMIQWSSLPPFLLSAILGQSRTAIRQRRAHLHKKHSNGKHNHFKNAKSVHDKQIHAMSTQSVNEKLIFNHGLQLWSRITFSDQFPFQLLLSVAMQQASSLPPLCSSFPAFKFVPLKSCRQKIFGICFKQTWTPSSKDRFAQQVLACPTMYRVFPTNCYKRNGRISLLLEKIKQLQKKFCEAYWKQFLEC